MNNRTPAGSENDLKLTWLKQTKKHLDVAADYIEYAMANGQANVRVDGFVDADRAMASAEKEIDAAKDCLTRATEAP